MKISQFNDENDKAEIEEMEKIMEKMEKKLGLSGEKEVKNDVNLVGVKRKSDHNDNNLEVKVEIEDSNYRENRNIKQNSQVDNNFSGMIESSLCGSAFSNSLVAKEKNDVLSLEIDVNERVSDGRKVGEGDKELNNSSKISKKKPDTPSFFGTKETNTNTQMLTSELENSKFCLNKQNTTKLLNLSKKTREINDKKEAKVEQEQLGFKCLKEKREVIDEIKRKVVEKGKKKNAEKKDKNLGQQYKFRCRLDCGCGCNCGVKRKKCRVNYVVCVRNGVILFVCLGAFLFYFYVFFYR